MVVACVVGGALVVVGAVVVAIVAGGDDVGGVASPSLLEQAASVSTADARTSTLPFRAISGWYFVPTITQWATAPPNRNTEPMHRDLRHLVVELVTPIILSR